MSRRKISRLRTAFTIIEMLVVISLVVLLIALLLPAIGLARYRARVVVCQSNMHQQHTAQTALAADNKTRFVTHIDHSPDYYRSNGATNSLWHQLFEPGYLTDGWVTICPIIARGFGQGNRYGDPSLVQGGYSGWNTGDTNVLTTYMWFANYRHGSGGTASGIPLQYQNVDGRTEPVWPADLSEAGSENAFITHRISGGAPYISHDLGHLGAGLVVSHLQLMQTTPEQPVTFADGHVILRGPGSVSRRVLINTGGIGYYTY